MARDSVVTLACVLIALAWLWPLPAYFGTGLVPDLGDPLLNTWILAWNFRQFEGGPEGYWDANIFYPRTGALAYSEILLPLALLVYPVKLLTGNPVAAYNAALVLSFALAGWGAFLLALWYLRQAPPEGKTARDPTDDGNGDHRAAAAVASAWIAALALAFSPYRIDQLPHIQTLWVGWFPFLVYATERYLDRPRAVWLYLAALAGVALALTKTYFALFGGVLLILFAVQRGLPTFLRAIRAGKVPLRHAAHAVVIAIVALAILGSVALGYRGAQEASGIERTGSLVSELSARPLDLFRGSHLLRFWGPLLGAEHEFGERKLFPGVATLLLALAGAVSIFLEFRRIPCGPARQDKGSPWRRRRKNLGIVLTLLGGSAIALLVNGLHIDWSFGPVSIRMTHYERPVIAALLGIALWTLNSPWWGRRGRDVLSWLSRPWTWLISGFLLMWIVAMGTTAGSEWWLARLVPMAAGLRAPTRAFGLALVCVVILAARGAYLLFSKLGRRAGVGVAVAICLVVLLESWPVPLTVNRPIWIYEHLDLEEILRDPTNDLGDRLAALPPGTPLVELPIGETQLALAYMYRSTGHWQPLMNGFSGFIPPDYQELREMMAEFPDDESLGMLRSLGIEWVVVHPEIYFAQEGDIDLDGIRADDRIEVVGYWADGLLLHLR